MSNRRAPLSLRLSVAVAGATLLLGVAGAVLVGARTRAGEGEDLSARVLRVRLRAVPQEARPAVEAHWSRDGMAVRETARQFDPEGDWIVVVPTEGEPITLVVLDDGQDPPRPLARLEVALPAPPHVLLDLSAPPP